MREQRWRYRRLQGFNYADPDHAYFVTTRACPGTAPFTQPALADEVVASLHWMRQYRGVIIYAYCLMPDHLHVLLRLGNETQTLGALMGAMKSFTTRQSWKHGWKGPLWQARIHDHILRRREDGRAIAEYIYANPARKGLVSDPATYPYSGFSDPL